MGTWILGATARQENATGTGKVMEENTLISTDLEPLSNTRYLLAYS